MSTASARSRQGSQRLPYHQVEQQRLARRFDESRRENPSLHDEWVPSTSRKAPENATKIAAHKIEIQQQYQRLDWVAVDAVSCELVSAIEVPANREIYREFLEIRRLAEISVLYQWVKSMVCSQIPYARKQGIA